MVFIGKKNVLEFTSNRWNANMGTKKVFKDSLVFESYLRCKIEFGKNHYLRLRYYSSATVHMYTQTKTLGCLRELKLKLY